MRIFAQAESREFLKLYRPTGDDPDIEALAESIKKYGLNEVLTVTSDNYIVSGHRRHASLERIGQTFAPCRVLPVRRDSMTANEYVALLREHNRQRNKTVAEQVREELVDVNPDDCYRDLQVRRNRSVNAPIYNGVQELDIEGTKTRCEISAQKAQHVEHVKRVVFQDRREYCRYPSVVRITHC